MPQNITFKHNYKIELAETLQGHYYSVHEILSNGKEKFLGYYPSSTTILQSYPTSEYLMEWVAKNGFHESRVIRDAAGRAGTKIHQAIQDLIEGKELDKIIFTTEEWVKLESFTKWYDSYQPEIIALEVPIFSKKGKYAGRLDCVAKIQGLIYVLDWKSSANLHKSFPLQFSSYAFALEENSNLKIDAVAALQLGAKNKNGYRFVIYDDWRTLHYPVFQHVHATWNYDNYDSLKNPKELPILTLPLTLKLNVAKEEKTKRTPQANAVSKVEGQTI